MVIVRLALRLLRNNPRPMVLLVANLIAGLLGFVGLDAFKRSVEYSVARQSRALLGADVVISSIDPLTPQQQRSIGEHLGEAVRQQRTVELYSMVAGKTQTRLVQVQGIERGFPMVGVFEVAGVAHPSRALNDAPTLVGEAQLAQLLGVAPGDTLMLGGQAFRWLGNVVNVSSRPERGFALAPRLFVGLRYLESTGLTDKGSRVSFRTLVSLPPDRDANAVAHGLRRALGGGALRIQSHREAGERVNGALIRLSDYLGLVALVALFLGALGVAYLFRSFILQHVGDLGILMSLGATVAQTQAMVACQLIFLGVVAAVLAWLGSWLLLPLLPQVLPPSWMPDDLELSVPLTSLCVALAVALLGAGALVWPQLRRLTTLRPAGLFREAGVATLQMQGGSVWLYIPCTLVFWLLAVWQSHSWVTGSVFVIVIGVSGALAAVVGWGAIGLANRGHSGVVLLRLAFRHMRSHQVASVTAFVAISLAALLGTLVPQLRASVEAKIQLRGQGALPSLFVFDIQEEQLEALEQLLTRLGHALNQTSPLVRARLISINDKRVDSRNDASDALETRETQAERRFHSRAYNLSYRTGLSASEILTAGRLPSQVASPSPIDAANTGEITLEQKFAARLGVGPGDFLTFDVQGVPVTGLVVGLRQVAWESFEPNFFVQFQPHVLEPAPKVFIGTVGPMDAGTRLQVQNALVDKFPNVSVVDVTQAVAAIRRVLDQVAWALGSMATIGAFSGLVLIFAIGRHQAQTRRREIGLMKALGASFRDVQWMFDLSSLLIAAGAAAVGISTCLVASAVLSTTILQAPWQADWVAAGIALAVIPLASVAVSRLASASALRVAPMVLLRDGPARFASRRLIPSNTQEAR